MEKGMHESASLFLFRRLIIIYSVNPGTLSFSASNFSLP